MLFQYLNCVFNIQSQHGIWKMLQHLLPNTEKMDYSWLTFLYCPVRLAKLVLLNTSGYRLISTSTSTPKWRIFLEIALSYVLHEASYWRLILIECLRYWLLHALALSCRPRGRVHSVSNFMWIMRLRTESRSQNTPCMSISHSILRIIRIPCRFIS